MCGLGQALQFLSAHFPYQEKGEKTQSLVGRTVVGFKDDDHKEGQKR